jgi:hypothetical protein
MKKTAKDIKKLAEALGITTDELLKEMEVGSPTKPFTVSISFGRLSAMQSFAEEYLAKTGLALYHSDALDYEYKGRAPGNTFVVRSPNDTHKPEDMRVF